MKNQSTVDTGLFPGLYPFHQWLNPTRDAVGEEVADFLALLAAPAHIIISGRDTSRCRAVVTLLHGNEPSGLIAVHQLLRIGFTPMVTLHVFVGSVVAAKTLPIFSHRMVPGRPDLNRCFKPVDTPLAEHRLAEGIVNTIAHLQPEAVVDIHNTSGNGPAFGVTTFTDVKHDILIGLFCDRQIVTELKLGALMEISEHLVPTVTIECGGARQETSHSIARTGIEKFSRIDKLFSETPPPMDRFSQPLRLELISEASVTYAKRLQTDYSVTLLPDIEKYNFCAVDETTLLGYVNNQNTSVFTVKTVNGRERFSEYFTVAGNELRPRLPLKLFMVTTNADIAKSDCILYLVPVCHEDDQR